MRQTFAPVAVFAFNRPEHFARTIEALAQNAQALETGIHVFLDGPRNEFDQKSQELILSFLASGIEKKFKYFSIIHAKENKGLANSIINGVTKIVNEFGKVIVLEDDLVTSKYFLQYMNDALDLYENEENVISIHGYLSPIKEQFDAPFFLKGADCWGWATWKRGWKLFEQDGSKLLAEIKEKRLENEFNFNNSYNYIGMLREQVLGKNNSWAIRWYASAFLKNKLTLYPQKSLVSNIGLDGSGIHCDTTSAYDVRLSQSPINNFPNLIKHSNEGFLAYSHFYRSVTPTFFKRVINKLKKMVIHHD